LNAPERVEHSRPDDGPMTVFDLLLQAQRNQLTVDDATGRAQFVDDDGRPMPGGPDRDGGDQGP